MKQCMYGHQHRKKQLRDACNAKAMCEIEQYWREHPAIGEIR